MSDEEYLRNRLDMINQNSHYGIMVDTEITKMVRDHMKELEETTMHEDCKDCVKRDICTRDVPKPCRYRYTEDERKADQASDIYGYILAGMYLPKMYLNKKEEMEMNATSVQVIKDVKDVRFSIDNDPVEMESKLTIIASTNDDIFAFEFEGLDLLQSCKRAGLFNDWEKDQKIRELEKDVSRWKKEAADCLKLRDEAQKEAYKLKKKNEQYEEKIKKLEHDDMLDKNAADYWSKEHDILLERFAKLQVENEELKEKLDVLQRKYNLEREANEAQHKFFRNYAGNGTEIEFNYAIGDTDEVSYVIVDKEEYQFLKDHSCNVMLHGKDYTPDQLVDRILELEKLKTPTIENFADEEPTSDNVNHPSHYTGKYECIDVMQDVFGNEATDNFCLCNAFKYIWRARKKNGLEDVKKAVWYLTRYIEEAEDGVRKGE